MDEPLEARRIVRRDEVSKLTGLARATIYKKGKRSQFPPAYPPGCSRRRLAYVGYSHLAAGPGEAMGPI